MNRRAKEEGTMTVHQNIEAAGAQRGPYAFSESLVTLSEPTGRGAVASAGG